MLIVLASTLVLITLLAAAGTDGSDAGAGRIVGGNGGNGAIDGTGVYGGMVVVVIRKVKVEVVVAAIAITQHIKCMWMYDNVLEKDN